MRSIDSNLQSFLNHSRLSELYPKPVLDKLRSLQAAAQSNSLSVNDMEMLKFILDVTIKNIEVFFSNLTDTEISINKLYNFINPHHPSITQEMIDWELEKLSKTGARKVTYGEHLPVKCKQHMFEEASIKGLSFSYQKELVLNLNKQDEQKYETSIIEIYDAIDSTKDDRNGRRTAAYNSLSPILDHLGYFEFPPKPTKKPLKVLQMLYGNSTYVCQALRNLGYDIEIVNLDINDFSNKQDIFNYEHVTADARQAIKALKGKKFDIIIHSSAGTDLFYLEDMKKVLNDSYKLLEKNGICIFSVKGVLATNSIEHIKSVVKFQNGKSPLISNGWAKDDRCIPYYDGYKQEIHNCIESFFDEFCKNNNIDWLYGAQQENEKNSCYQSIRNLKYRPTLNPFTDLKIGKKINHDACVLRVYKGIKGADKGPEHLKNIKSFQTLNWFSFVK